ncbi:MAG: Gfo/Idh/MocA family oxidoreductase, partial [bacterium]|nr:Gfo/Idh/MocA family oxidoreductase [bacterium]
MESQTNRRSFLLMSAVAASATPLEAAEKAEVRTAMIGVGNRGTGLTKQVLSQSGVKITAICDIDAQKRDAAQGLAQRDNPRSFADYREVLDLKEVDAVVVATPCDLHAEMAAAAMDAGKHIYCEKPLGVTPEQVALAVKAVRRSKAVFQIGQQLRYYPPLQATVRQLHEAKVAGEIFAIKAQRHSTYPEKPRARPAWYLDVKRSGDLIVENAVHNI